MQRFLHSKCFYDLIGYKNIHNLCQGLHTQIIFLCAKPNDTLQNAGSSFASPHHPRFTCAAKSAPSRVTAQGEIGCIARETPDVRPSTLALTLGLLSVESYVNSLRISFTLDCLVRQHNFEVKTYFA